MSKNRFVNPPAANSADNPQWYLGELQTVSWITELKDYEISIWQQFPTESVANYSGVVFSTSSGASTNFTWAVQTYGRDLDFSNVFFFWAGRGDENTFTSNYFNISKEKPPTQTTSAISTPTPSPTEVEIPSSSAEPPRDKIDQKKAGLATKAKIGLGVGLSVGVPVLVFICFMVYKATRRRKRPVIPQTQDEREISELPSKRQTSLLHEPVELQGEEVRQS
ncbi:hypothetical protein McanCB56680_005389 [Microsporum canis]